MRGLARFVVMLFAYLMAVGAATAVFLMLLYLSKADLLARVGLLSSVTRSDVFHPFVVTVIGTVAAVFTLLPVLVALVFAEACGSRSARYFLVWGVAAWAGLWLLFGLRSWLESARTFEMLIYEMTTFAAGGLTWGFVYWIIAGRTSGDWIDARRAG
jgi:hypothetical protein